MLRLTQSLNETSYQSLATKADVYPLDPAVASGLAAKTLTMDLTSPKGVNQWTGQTSDAPNFEDLVSRTNSGPLTGGARQ